MKIITENSNTIRSPAVQKLTGFSDWKPWEAHGRRPQAFPGLPGRETLSFCTGGTSLFYFTTFLKNFLPGTFLPAGKVGGEMNI